jgi:acyl transferase domain-containing protein
LSHVEEARYLLEQLTHHEFGPNLFEGKVPKGFSERSVTKQFGNRLLDQVAALHNDKTAFKEPLSEVVSLYCQGYDLDWWKLFGGERLPPISLPGYPFVRKNFWSIPVAKQTEKTPQNTASFHPFIRHDFTNGGGPRFGATFTGQEFFLRDHIVAGEKVFPGVAHLEMARAAHALAVPDHNDRLESVMMRNIVWMRPLRVGDMPVSVRVMLGDDNGTDRHYKITVSAGDDTSAEENFIVYSQGVIGAGRMDHHPSLDLQKIEADCRAFEIAPAEAYAAYRRQEIHYGSAFKGIEQLFVGDSQVLVRLSLPRVVEDTIDQFIMHPSMLDAARQASIGLLRPTDGPHLPYGAEGEPTRG